MRRAVEPNGIVGYRLAVEEFSDGGLTNEQACRAAGALSATGQIDYFSLSQGNFTSIEKHLPDRHQAPGVFTWICTRGETSRRGDPNGHLWPIRRRQDG